MLGRFPTCILRCKISIARVPVDISILSSVNLGTCTSGSLPGSHRRVPCRYQVPAAPFDFLRDENEHSNTDRDETIRNMQAAVQRRTLRMLGHLRASTVAASTVAAHDSRVGVALIGYGAIGSVVAEAIISGQAGPTKLAAVLVARERSTRPPELPTDCYFGTDLDGFFSAEWDICVEAAGQPTVGAMAASPRRCSRA